MQSEKEFMSVEGEIFAGKKLISPKDLFMNFSGRSKENMVHSYTI